MRIIYSFYLFVIAISCRENNVRDEYKVPMLLSNVKAFIGAKKCFNETIDILVVNLNVEKDTLYVEIADTYPNIKELKFNCDTIINQHRVIFTGEKIKGFCQSSSNNQFPKDIIETNKNQKWKLFEEYTNWLFVYHKGKLIRQSLPCSEEGSSK
jgi:hypothetical protein